MAALAQTKQANNYQGDYKMNAKIEAAKQQAMAELADRIAKIEYEEMIRNIAPNPEEPEGVTYHKYNGVDCIRYEAKSAQDVVRIINEWRAEYGRFLPIGKYSKGCTVVSAHTWGEYADQAALKNIEDDGVEARNSKGKGFSTVSFTFYYVIEGRKLEICIELAFRVYVQGFEGRIDANYNRHGDCTSAQKTVPVAYRSAQYVVSFGGGSRDSADWRGVFNYDAFMSEFEGV